MKSLRPSELLAGTGAAVAVGALFLPWYMRGDAAISGWRAFVYTDVALCILLAVPLAFILVTIRRDSPALPVILGVFATLTGFAASALVLIRIVDPPAALTAVRPGAYLGLLSALGSMLGSWSAVRDEHPRGRATEVEGLQLSLK